MRSLCRLFPTIARPSRRTTFAAVASFVGAACFLSTRSAPYAFAAAEAISQRTIIIGDVHGCLDELKALLSKCGYRKGVDRVILVGDLVGKGPLSTETVQFVMQNKFECIRGNHDEFIMNWQELKSKGENPQPIKSPTHADVVARLSKEEWSWLRSLPYWISLPGAMPTLAAPLSDTQPPQFAQPPSKTDVLVVHAGLVPQLPLNEQDRDGMVNMRNLLYNDSKGRWEWKGTTEVGRAWASVWNGPQHVVFGHDAVRGLQTHPFATGLDTGCCYGLQLTALVLPQCQLVSVNAARVYSPPGQPMDRHPHDQSKQQQAR